MGTTVMGVPGVEARTQTGPAQGFFQRPLPAKLILTSFFVLTLPLAALLSSTSAPWVLTAYLCLFGTTHFVITFVVYLRRENLRHFSAGWANKIRYFGIPLLLFAAFYFIGVLRLVATFPLFGMAFRCLVRAADFNHLNRQSFGVHQLFKVRAGLRAPATLKTLENLYFNSLSVLLYCTFLAGGRSPLLGGEAGPALVPKEPLRLATYCVLSVSLGLLTIVVAGSVRAWRQAGRPEGLGELLTYLGFQTASAALPIVSLPLYAAALAMHYVEYHVLMFPRCFHSKLDEKSAIDRWFGRLRSNRLGFYAAVVGASVFVYTVMAFSVSLMGMDARPDASRYLAFAAVFDGLFVFHYFVETLIWRFGDPFYRKELGLYFAPQR